MKTFQVVSINISKNVGEKKMPVAKARLVAGHGIEGDAHARNWHRQVSFLAQEDIDGMAAKGAQVGPGDFAENITTKGVDLVSLPVGTKFSIGEAEFEVTQIGKECHDKCAIYEQVGDCIMPRRGIFTKVITGGTIGCESIGAYRI